MRNASTVWPLRIRPERSVTVPEMMSGTVFPDFSKDFRDRRDRGLCVQGVENGFHHQEIDAAFEECLSPGLRRPVESDRTSPRENWDRSHRVKATRSPATGPTIPRQSVVDRFRSPTVSAACRATARPLRHLSPARGRGNPDHPRHRWKNSGSFASALRFAAKEEIVQPDRRGTKSVGLDDVRAGFEIPPV